MDTIAQVAHRLVQAEQVTARVVIVPEGADPAPYLLAAGIIDPIKLPFSAGEGASAASMSDGATPAVKATIVLDPEEEAASAEPVSTENGTSHELQHQEQHRRTASLPDALGRRTMAPV